MALEKRREGGTLEHKPYGKVIRDRLKVEGLWWRVKKFWATYLLGDQE